MQGCVTSDSQMFYFLSVLLWSSWLGLVSVRSVDTPTHSLWLLFFTFYNNSNFNYGKTVIESSNCYANLKFCFFKAAALYFDNFLFSQTNEVTTCFSNSFIGRVPLHSYLPVFLCKHTLDARIWQFRWASWPFQSLKQARRVF